jgi:hypothetical protein
MKPFDLEKALAGAKVVTRDGKEVTQLTKFDVYGNYPLTGIINKQRETFKLDGRFGDNKESNCDLFMAEEKKSIFLKIYENKFGQLRGCGAYDTLEQANAALGFEGLTYIKTVEITNEK